MTVTVKITDSEGKTVCEDTKDETSNDFGVVSMSVGDSETFGNADWSKLPFFIEASVDGRLLGKSQLLSVSVAEYAKKSGELTIESIEYLCSKEWICKTGNTTWSMIFKRDGSCLTSKSNTYGFSYSNPASFFIDGNDVIIISAYNSDDGSYTGYENSTIYKYIKYSNKLYHAYVIIFEEY